MLRCYYDDMRCRYFDTRAAITLYERRLFICAMALFEAEYGERYGGAMA